MSTQITKGEARNPENVIKDAITETVVHNSDGGFAVIPGRAADRIMRELRLNGFDVIDTLRAS